MTALKLKKVNKYLENYEMALTGFEADALKDPGLNATEEVQKIVNLLDKLDNLLRIQFVNGRVPQSISEIRGLVCEDITGGLEDIAIPASNLVNDPPVALPVDVVNMVILASIKELRLKAVGALFSLICEV
ncbi:uncharacterized protein LOC133708536 [Rosa rugosa]|uniref:uncharacterized protein LOC133708536 n=1 Tax=Rosa rugosa TaxID=74645 RepID=UPI002B404873|nr:uncharacterized protein LOC133708536 [Rosa rugosa]XP_061989990.1 uncharacterized protein LOC133708536 [Rosa rugosa]XP_061989991.1 uncharacterized protein LOC133708536 [Rosa rugosa]XP_061989992.1 uncharacterized protein LOC133708536 [Rosa rugosa]XP_061989993.1 uncharacterized protein LOC133708536 [Rosa rugosa]XP_061989994.1 uncharacterized protein LOC133708536 [Rosa rugosa]XP_061989995.1 uncharacterized protein LOC133708536 [Rosa rugosa]XP_061989996.1 uncharacterized protein LOC133708536 [